MVSHASSLAPLFPALFMIAAFDARLHDRRRARCLLRVVGGHVDIYRAQQVIRAGQIVLLIPVKVAKVHHAELAKRDHHPDRVGVLSFVQLEGPIARAQWISLPGPGRGRVIALPYAVTTSTSIPSMGIRSPAFTSMCLPLARTAR